MLHSALLPDGFKGGSSTVLRSNAVVAVKRYGTLPHATSLFPLLKSTGLYIAVHYPVQPHNSSIIILLVWEN